MIDDPKVISALIGASVGAVLGFLAAEMREWLARRRRRKAHWQALSAEAELCKESAEEYLRANVAAPLYRLPTLSYLHSFPILLSDGALNEAETRAVTQFFAQVETLNRGLEQANEARGDEKKLSDEFVRNRMKAEKLIESTSYYTKVRAVLNNRSGSRYVVVK